MKKDEEDYVPMNSQDLKLHFKFHLLAPKNDIEVGSLASQDEAINPRLEYPDPDSPITETQARSSMTKIIMEEENQEDSSSKNDIELRSIATQDEDMNPRLEHPDPDCPITETQARGLMTEIIG